MTADGFAKTQPAPAAEDDDAAEAVLVDEMARHAAALQIAELAEGAGVDVAELTADGERDHDVGVLDRRVLRRRLQQLAAHAEVDDEQGADQARRDEGVVAVGVERVERVGVGEPGVGEDDPERRAQYDNVKMFISQAEDAIKAANFEFGRNMAEKAERLAKELRSRYATIK